jgi:hypothetical protein
MPARTDTSIEKIGKRLRDEWSELLTSPLPERLLLLLDQLERRETSEPPPKNRQH